MQDAKSALAAPETGDGAIRCPEKLKPGGCQLHNLQCGWPKCNEPEVAQPAEEPATRLSGEDAKRMGLETCPVCDAAMHCPNCGCISVAQPSPREPESRVIDEAALERLFERGAVAWAGVQSQPSPREQEHAGEALTTDDEFRAEGARLFAEFIDTNFWRRAEAAESFGVSPAFISQLCSGEKSIPERFRIAADMRFQWVAALRTAAQPEHAPQAEVAEGCTPTDARVLRLANHALAQESFDLQEVLADLYGQVKAFCETQGEAEFYTGHALYLLSRLRPETYRWHLSEPPKPLRAHPSGSEPPMSGSGS